MTLQEIRDAALPACQDYDVKRLDAFGSTARGESTGSSDVDLLVEFHDPEIRSSRRFFGLLHHLEDTLDCKIDLLTPNGLRNPYIRDRILEERVNIYEG